MLALSSATNCLEIVTGGQIQCIRDDGVYGLLSLIIYGPCSPAVALATDEGGDTLQIHPLLRKQQRSQMQQWWLTRPGSPSRRSQRRCKWIHHCYLHLDLPCHVTLLSCVPILMLQTNVNVDLFCSMSATSRWHLETAL